MYLVISGSPCTPECEEELKPAIGMTFERIKVLVNFQKVPHMLVFKSELGKEHCK